MSRKLPKTLEEFYEKLQLCNGAEFVGIANILDVDCFFDSEKKEAKDGQTLIGEVVNAFLGANRKQRKYIWMLLLEVEKENKLQELEKNGTRAKDAEAE